MALKVFQVIIFLITFVKYTCLRRKNSKTMRPTASHRVKNITNNETIFPGKLGTVWKRIMSNIINTKLKFTKKHISVLLLSKLRRKNQGTNDVEHFVKHMGNPKMKNLMRRRMMKTKIEDAKLEESRLRSEYDRGIKYLKRKLGHLTL